MPKSLHHCCRIYCSLDAEITALLIAENTALLDAVNKRLRTDYTDNDPDLEAGFYNLRHTLCPAVLTENLFMDNANDVDFLQSHSGKEAITMLHVEGIREYLCE